jgi:para-nitrobenzyl esterase
VPEANPQRRRSSREFGSGPTVDGRLVTMRSFFEGGPEVSKHVPMLIGSVSEEGNRMLSRPTEAEWLATLTKNYGRRIGSLEAE